MRVVLYVDERIPPGQQVLEYLKEQHVEYSTVPCSGIIPRLNVGEFSYYVGLQEIKEGVKEHQLARTPVKQEIIQRLQRSIVAIEKEIGSVNRKNLERKVIDRLNELERLAIKQISDEPSKGETCCKCKEFNPYANKDGSTFTCYRCRNGL